MTTPSDGKQHARSRSGAGPCPVIQWDSPAARTLSPSRRILLVNPLILKNGKHHHFLTDWTGSEYPSSLLLPSMEFLYLHAVLAREGSRVDFLDASAKHGEC